MFGSNLLGRMAESVGNRILRNFAKEAQQQRSWESRLRHFTQTKLQRSKKLTDRVGSVVQPHTVTVSLRSFTCQVHHLSFLIRAPHVSAGHHCTLHGERNHFHLVSAIFHVTVDMLTLVMHDGCNQVKVVHSMSTPKWEDWKCTIALETIMEFGDRLQNGGVVKAYQVRCNS